MSRTLVLSNYAYPALVAGLRALGWEVLADDSLNWWTWCHGDPGRGLPQRSAREFGAHLRQAVKESGACAVVLGKACDSNVPAPGASPSFWHVSPDDLRQLRDAGVAVVLLDLDQPDSLPWITHSGVAGSCDAIGTCCVGARTQLAAWTQAEVFEFWPAWDEALRGTERPQAREEWECDLAMVGTPYYRCSSFPEIGVARRDVALRAREMGARVKLWGGDHWLRPELGGDPSLADCYMGPADWGDLHAIFASARITYNSFIRRGFRYLNDRVPIAGGAGSFVLMEAQAGLEQEFRQGVHVGYCRYDDIPDLSAQLEWWLSHEPERRQAAERMRQHVFSRHTYAQRAEVVSAAVEAAVGRRTKVTSGASCCRAGAR